MGLQRVGHNWSDLVHTHAQLSDWATATRKMPWTWPKVFPDTSLPLNSGIVCWVPALAGLTVSGLWVFSGSLLPPPCWCSSSGLYSESLALTSISLGVFVLSSRSPLWVSLPGGNTTYWGPCKHVSQPWMHSTSKLSAEPLARRKSLSINKKWLYLGGRQCCLYTGNKNTCGIKRAKHVYC